VSFLKNVVRKLNLTDTVIINERIEHLREDSKESGSYDVVVSRATFHLSQYLAKAIPFLSTDGVLIAMKGKSFTQELEDAKDILCKMCIKLVECHEIGLPIIGNKRFILVFKRV
jgi:16S rRNA (guanine527-N7)-methyltransferase